MEATFLHGDVHGQWPRPRRGGRYDALTGHHRSVQLHALLPTAGLNYYYRTPKMPTDGCTCGRSRFVQLRSSYQLCYQTSSRSLPEPRNRSSYLLRATNSFALKLAHLAVISVENRAMSTSHVRFFIGHKHLCP